MLHFERWKIVAIVLACLAGLIGSLPNFFDKETVAHWPSWMPVKQIGLGLDLRGGAHLLYSMDTADLKKRWLETLQGDARKQLRDAKIGFTGLGISSNGVLVKLGKPEETDAAYRDLKKLVQPIGSAILRSGGYDISVEKGAEPGTIVIQPTEQGILDRISNAASAAIEVVRRRVDPTGTVESSIVRQGSDRILVQVPGVSDTATLKKRIGDTAKLSFHQVHPSVRAEEAKQTRVPIGYKLVDSGEREEGRRDVSYLIAEVPVVEGTDLVDAQQGFDQRNNEPIINFRFNQAGARKFGKFTETHVGEPFAIVLDNGRDPATGKEDIYVISAPNIREPILGGSGQISGSFTVESANNLSIQLRSGALPTKLTIVEERTVGPSLGADSISAGKKAALIGTALVTTFMLFAYGLFGIFAVLAVIINILMIMAVMTVMGSTLTLPGIAGLVLTVGMAVDANVLIYERIREELRTGRTPISAIDAGFSRALGTILDSNLTTLIAGLVMFWLGSGPVRGFAVTLSVGILTTVFTAFTVTRLLVALWLQRYRGQKVPAPL